VITVSDLAKTYPGTATPAVDGVSFSVPEGGFYTLLGPSGCGKTTTLRCIAGLERPDRGTIQLGDTVVMSDRIFVPPHRRDIGMVFQSYAVWPHMTVFENVAFPLRVGGRKLGEQEVRAKVMAALDLVGLAGFERRMATQLSGGQQQRLSLARALVRAPAVLLLDEPLSNLDAKLRERMRGELLLIQKRTGITTLFVTHDQVEALSMSDRIAVMDRGRIVQEGTPQEIYHSPANEFVAGFIGSTNLLRGEVVGADPVSGWLRLKTSVGTLVARGPAGILGPVVVGIRPEDIIVHRGARHANLQLEGPNVVEAVVEIGQFTGTYVEYRMRTDATVLMVRTSSRADLQRNEPAQLEIPPESIRVFVVRSETPHAPAGK
jgi:iron(III) transport system ATP-binding protein